MLGECTPGMALVRMQSKEQVKVSAEESKTPGQQFFDAHVGYLYRNDIDGLLADQYADDAILISPFDVLEDAKPPHVIHNGPKLKEFFTKWLAYHGETNYTALYDFAELDDTVSFQALMTSQTGNWVLGEAWHRNAEGKIDRHYGFAHKLD